MNSNYKELLSGLTKKQLDNIRRMMDVKGVSGLKKDDLIEVLNEKALERLSHVFENHITEQHKNYIADVIKNNCCMKVSSQEEEEYLDSLQGMGIVFKREIEEEKFAAIPEKLKESLASLVLKNKIEEKVEEQKIEENQEEDKETKEVIKYVNALLNYYGVIEYKKLYNIIKLYMKDLDNAKCVNILMSYAETSKDMQHNNLLFYNKDVVNPKDVFEKQNLRSDIPYKIFTKEQLLRASKEGDFELDLYRNKLYTVLIKELAIEPDEALRRINKLIVDIQNENKFIDSFNRLCVGINFVNMNQVNNFTSLVNELHNHTRLWVLKGYTPEEIMEKIKVETAKNDSKKVGRNELCPCGSGKKYKKCCGKNI